MNGFVQLHRRERGRQRVCLALGARRLQQPVLLRVTGILVSDGRGKWDRLEPDRVLLALYS